MRQRIYLSPPNVDDREQQALTNALAGGWVAPVGPELDLFTKHLESYFRGKKALLLNSGTSALHLSLILAGIEAGDHVLSSTMTFAACANVIRYQHAIPVFIDSEADTWNIDPGLLKEYLAHCETRPKAVIVTHMYGVPARIAEIKKIVEHYDIPLIEDAAESLGATYEGQPLGAFGKYGIVSFNGNKIVTTSAGGALICDDEEFNEGLHLATQANRGVGEYDHDHVGYNYRMSNLLASLGISQFEKLEVFLQAKRKIFNRYRDELSPWISFPKEQEHNQSSYWLTTGLMKSDQHPMSLIEWLERDTIEARRLWKPLHLHEAYNMFEFVGSGISEELFEKGICLPSGTGLTEAQQTGVIDSVKRFFEQGS